MELNPGDRIRILPAYHSRYVDLIPEITQGLYVGIVVASRVRSTTTITLWEVNSIRVRWPNGFHTMCAGSHLAIVTPLEEMAGLAD